MVESNEKGRRRNSGGPIAVDIMIEIFARLPAKSVMKFKCLSKQYSSMIQSRDFANSFLSHSSNKPRVLFSFTTAEALVIHSATTHTDEPSPLITRTIGCRMAILGSYLWMKTPPVRGLICYSLRPNQHVIWNPSTRQFLRLPGNETCNVTQCDEYLLFGYEPISDRFKVITILIDSPKNHHEQQCWIFDVGDGNSWRKIQDIPYHYRPDLDVPLGICINGVLYYKVHPMSPYHDIKVVSFDLNSEKFSFIKSPPDALKIPKLIDFGGKLAFIEYLFRGFRIWVLENAEKHEWSSRTYDIPRGLSGCSAAGICEGEIVFVPPRVHPRFFTCHLDLEKKTTRRVDIELPSDKYGYVTYVSTNHIENVIMF